VIETTDAAELDDLLQPDAYRQATDT